MVAVFPSVVPEGRGPIGPPVLNARRSTSSSDLVITAPEGDSGTGTHARRVGFLT